MANRTIRTCKQAYCIGKQPIEDTFTFCLAVKSLSFYIENINPGNYHTYHYNAMIEEIIDTCQEALSLLEIGEEAKAEYIWWFGFWHETRRPHVLEWMKKVGVSA